MTLILRDELAAAVTAESPPSDLVSLSRRAGQRQLARRRRGALAGAGIAIAAVVVASGAMPHWWAQNQRTATTGDTSSPLPGPSKTAVPAVAVTGTAADWLAALERWMPYVERTKAVGASTNGPTALSQSSSVQAVFDYTSEGRTTSLVVTALAKDTQASPGKSALDTMLAACDQSGVSCEPVQQTVAGPVLIRHALSRGFVDAVSFRASGVMVVARTPELTAAAVSPQPGAGLPGLAINLDDLVNIAALSPEPVLAASPPTSSPTPSGASPVVTVTSGQKVDLGSGSYLTVTKAEKCMVIADASNALTPNCKSLTDGNQAPKSISMQSGSGGGATPEIITGIYTGTDATTITVTVDGTSQTATIVKLGSHPTSLVYYLTLPTAVAAGSGAGGSISVEAFDARGRSLTKL